MIGHIIAVQRVLPVAEPGLVGSGRVDPGGPQPVEVPAEEIALAGPPVGGRERRGQQVGDVGTGALDRVCPAAEGTWVWVAVRSDAPTPSSSGWSAPSACPSWPPTIASPGWRTGLRGQHDRAILAELGFGEDEVAELEAAGPVIPPA